MSGLSIEDETETTLSPSKANTAQNAASREKNTLPATDTTAAAVSPVELSTFKQYLRAAIPLLMDADERDVERSLFAHSASLELLQQFLSDAQMRALVLLKSKGAVGGAATSGENKENTSVDTMKYSYSVHTSVTYAEDQLMWLVLVKRTPHLDSSRSLQQQLQVIQLPSGSIGKGGTIVFEGLHAFIQHGMAPLFNAYVDASAEKSATFVGEGKTTVARDDNAKAAARKIMELGVTLFNLQQNVEIPEIRFLFHPRIQKLVQKVIADNRRPFKDEEKAELASDTFLVNQLVADVDTWVHEVQKLSQLSKDVIVASAMQEVSFWPNLEKELESVDRVLKGQEMALVRNVLDYATLRKPAAQIRALSVAEPLETAQKYNLLMRDFPLSDLLSATEPVGIRDAMISIFGHLNKKLKISPYPVQRALKLVDGICQDFARQMAAVLGKKKLMLMDFAAFEATFQVCDETFRIWDDQVKDFVAVAREVTRKRLEKFIPIKINVAHTKIQERLEYLHGFRKKHHQLRDTITKVMLQASGSTGEHVVAIADLNAIDEVDASYDCVKFVDALDISLEGTEAWVIAENAYTERVARVENQIIASLRERLATAKTSNEMFHVFSKFNVLFVRPKIRGAIQEYQTQLLNHVKDDIRKLQEKYKMHYDHSSIARMSKARDIPPVSGAIIWAMMIGRQLENYMKRVEDVLGKGWELYADGQKLLADSEAFRKKLDPRVLFDKWAEQNRNVSVTGQVFEITKIRNVWEIRVNFKEEMISLFKEVRHMVSMNFPVTHTLLNVAKDARRVYPYAVSLTETLRTYNQTVALIRANEDLSILTTDCYKNVQSVLEENISVTWDGFLKTYDERSNPFVQRFSSAVATLQDTVLKASAALEETQKQLDQLVTCRYHKSDFAQVLSQIQKLIDQASMESYSNFKPWVARLDRKIENVLCDRLAAALNAWMVKFDCPDRKEPAGWEEDPQSITRQFGHLEFPMLTHELKMRNQEIYLDPPVEMARVAWFDLMHSWMNHICTLDRIASSRYEVGAQVSMNPDVTTYRILPARLDGLLDKAYMAIQKRMIEVEKGVNLWMKYQSLWYLDAEYVYSQVGEDLTLWQRLIIEVKKARATFDTSTSESIFGGFKLEFDQIQSKVGAKYDAWQKEIIAKFALKLDGDMRSTHSHLHKARDSLEHQPSLETCSTADAIVLVTLVEDLKQRQVNWGETLENLRIGQRELERNRFQFPNDWLHVETVEGEWGAFNKIYGKKLAAVDLQKDSLMAKVEHEGSQLQKKISEISAEWDQTKPIQGSIKYTDALNRLTKFEGQFKQLDEEVQLIRRARMALNMETMPGGRLESMLEEAGELKGVWSALSKIWVAIDELKDGLWNAIVHSKLRMQLEGLLAQTRELPSAMRQYAAFEYLQEALKGYVKVNALIKDMKSDTVRDRHWKSLLKILKLERQSMTQLTLGQIWNADLRANESAVREVLVVATGEMALEEFLRQVREFWQSYSLNLIVYQNKCRLIQGWEELFAKCSENLGSLSSMKASPYYKIFEDEANAWEDKLNRIHVLFDVWIDVQRQWVYLEGIFNGATDIKSLLPLEASRFSNINTEFLTLMKRVAKTPNVLDVITFPGVQKSLEKLAELLSKIQKALGEYLERERSAFPRFYFVGDEDLLEIIGNDKNVGRVQKHFKKMFPGVARVEWNEASGEITSIVSGEGETITLRTSINVGKSARCNEWLGALEKGVRTTLALTLLDAFQHLSTVLKDFQSFTSTDMLKWMETHPAQLVTLSMQIFWTFAVERELTQKKAILLETDASSTAFLCERLLDMLAAAISTDGTSVLTRMKCEHLITVLVHQRDVCRKLNRNHLQDATGFDWQYYMRFYLDPSQKDPLRCLRIKMAGAEFEYGFEYNGVQDKLVQTPLTDRCYLAMTQALHTRFGGSPFGPAGTGKTETVKALAHQLGKFVVVFCCDENFDFQAMGRIFVGSSQVGAWVCFDEFNRLDEKILSAVSQQVQVIQEGLRRYIEHQQSARLDIELLGRSVPLSPDAALFITMNPGYAGRSNLPNNLKKLFRPLAMTKPDNQLIAQVMLFAQGFRSAETLASKIVPLFSLCGEQLSSQPHYDFGLRALKSVLVSAGNLKRRRLKDGAISAEQQKDAEQVILLQSIHETLVPKLVAEDIFMLNRLLKGIFPGVKYKQADLETIKKEIFESCKRRCYVPDDSWITKILQLYQILNIHHGVMLVGVSGTGKSSALSVLAEALEHTEKRECVVYRIDPKAVKKEHLYGHLDSTTREWTDGLFTQTLRRIIDNVRGESEKRHWIVFDGDVDPEWVENLNSVLDDNKLLTLPNGERLALPPNVRVIFEVENLKYATLATVSRCGMVWFSENLVTVEMTMRHFLDSLRASALPMDAHAALTEGGSESEQLKTQSLCADILFKHFFEGGFVPKALQAALDMSHIMEFTPIRALNTLFSLVKSAVKAVIEYNSMHTDFPLEMENIETYLSKKLLYFVVWSFSGDCKMSVRNTFSSSFADMANVVCDGSVLDFDVQLPKGDWVPWKTKVATIEMDTQSVSKADVVIPTVDTVRHEHLLYALLANETNVILCGPAGSGKTMSLFTAIRKLPGADIVALNFSSATTPELVLRCLETRAEYRKTPDGVELAPATNGKRLIVFFDEINLPLPDKYGTQRAISFLRQMMEHGGFWRSVDKAWVSIRNIQFVGACNPPTDPGRVPMGARFLRHSALILVDYPEEESLKQIYGTFARGMLKVIPSLRTYAVPLTNAMVELFLASQNRFTTEQQAHYVYSPRELTRWIRGIFEAIQPLESLSVEGLVRIWAHEALRLFQDRLLFPEEKEWTEKMIDEIACKHFLNLDQLEALERPILFSNWLTKHYLPVGREALREFVKARVKVFQEEELDVHLVLFDDLLDHALRIDRVFRQMQGHMLLIGLSGSGKTTLARFVAWMNGLSVFQVKVHSKYSIAEFDEDLRHVLRRAGCKNEKICFIMDESSVTDPGFLERMNTLLANAEIPGLFEGDEYNALLNACKEGSAAEKLSLDTPEELMAWFTKQIMKNFHVVFTMNPPAEGLATRAATSPALFNRCVIDWFGDWTDRTLLQVASEFVRTLDIDMPGFQPPTSMGSQAHLVQLTGKATYRDMVVSSFASFHRSVGKINAKLKERLSRTIYLTPRHFLDFVTHFVRLHHEKQESLEDQQRHLNTGLDKLNETVGQVEEMRKSLAVKKIELEQKSEEANQKLKQMIEDQQKAEEKRAASLKIRKDLEIQTAAIEERKKVVVADLANAEPAVLEAQRSVSGIKKQHLTEVRSMVNPPTLVKLTMEAVCVLLRQPMPDGWKSVQQIIRRDDFIPSIVNYDTQKMMTKAMRGQMEKYLAQDDFNFETVDRASKACGPLALWVIAQVNYSSILDRVGPLREEVETLESSAKETDLRLQTMETILTELEESIVKYKEEYALLISETQVLKQEMERVKQKVDRSLLLITNLSSEQSRWDASRAGFGSQMRTLVGDTLLSAAFLAYSGIYDQSYRESLFGMWTQQLERAGVVYRKDLLLIENLSTADERMSWSANSLPNDDLCVENAILMNRYQRFPLIIDPSSQVLEFLRNEYSQKKIIVTSFLDNSFLKSLESSLRFGVPLVITDVECYDPILDAVLNRELYRAGGRVLIRLGNQEIDFSPSFRLFLFTRDQSAAFSPDISSRVTFVNFSVTHASLLSQCLGQVLKAERPDIDQKRRTLQKLQGEFQVRLRTLEKSLLQSLSDAKGTILEDDQVVTTLESLKLEATDIEKKITETDAVLEEVEQVTRVYSPLARAASSIYFCLDQLYWINHFYRFDLNFFYEIFHGVIKNVQSMNGVVDPMKRIEHLRQTLFEQSFEKTSRSLLHQDCLILAFMLARIKMDELSDSFDDREYAVFLGLSDRLGSVAPSSTAVVARFKDVLTETRLQEFAQLIHLPGFKDIVADLEQNEQSWREFMASRDLSGSVPVLQKGRYAENIANIFHEALMVGSSTAEKFRELLLIKTLRPDRLVSSMHTFSTSILGKDLLTLRSYDLKKIITHEVSSSTPIAICSVPDHDASYRVEHLATELSMKMTTVAMGSVEGYTLAESAIVHAAKTGNWVLLKNLHLAIHWLGTLEKKLHNLHPHKAFRLFITMEVHNGVPPSLLRMSRIFMFEPTPGLRDGLTECLKDLEEEPVKGPIEKNRLQFLLAFLHTQLFERMRYLPLGWSKAYDFNESDFTCALGVIDYWVDLAAAGKTNISPSKIPWSNLRTMLMQAVYGGRIDNEFDQRILDSFVRLLFSERSFDVKFGLIEDADSKCCIRMPEGTQQQQFVDWAVALPETQTPAWLRLGNDVDTVVLITEAKRLLANIRRFFLHSESEATVMSDENKASEETSHGMVHKKAFHKLILSWLSLLPKSLLVWNAVARTAVDHVFSREYQVGKKLLEVMHVDLGHLVQVLEGSEKSTNHDRDIMDALSKGKIPDSWKAYAVPRSCDLNSWFQDLLLRLKQLDTLRKSVETGKSMSVWLGGLFFPEAYLTATRQVVAERMCCSIEELSMEFVVGKQVDGGFSVEGLSSQGLQWDAAAGKLILGPSTATRLPSCQVSWKHAEPPIKGRVTLPVYANLDRFKLVCKVELPTDLDTDAVYLRGAALVANAME